jgi:hypothetical protein
LLFFLVFLLALFHLFPIVVFSSFSCVLGLLV